MGQSPSIVSTSQQETTHEDVKGDAKNYKSFIMRRSAWIKENGGGIDEVQALKNIFYSFLFAIKQNESSRGRQLINFDLDVKTLNPFFQEATNGFGANI
jgi:hypothetical protein